MNKRKIVFLILIFSCFAVHTQEEKIVEFNNVPTVLLSDDSKMEETNVIEKSMELKNDEKQKIQLNEPIATVIAASIAAILSFITLLQNVKSESREAYRNSLNPYLEELSECIHEIMAFSTIMLKNKTEESLLNYKEKANAAKDRLKELRKKIRYPLWGIDEYIQKLSRVSDYTSYTLGDKKIAQENVKQAKLLAKAIDKCVFTCYKKGRSPILLEQWYIRYRTWKFLKVREKYRKERPLH